MSESRCVECGAPVSGFAAVRNDNDVVVAMRKLRPTRPCVCLWCLPTFVARGGRLEGVAAEPAVREEVDRG